MIRQPDECSCFGGSCWKYLCHNRNSVSKAVAKERDTEVKEQVDRKKLRKRRRRQILTLNKSRAKATRSAND